MNPVLFDPSMVSHCTLVQGIVFVCVTSYAHLWHYVSNTKLRFVICVITGTLFFIHVKTEIQIHVGNIL